VVRIPLSFDVVRKTRQVIDKKNNRTKRVSEKTKNTQYRDKLRISLSNNIKYRNVLNDVWYSSKENMNFIEQELKKEFIMPLKSNRKIALSKEDKIKGNYVT